MHLRRRRVDTRHAKLSPSNTMHVHRNVKQFLRLNKFESHVIDVSSALLDARFSVSARRKDLS